jgi:hypothetical protein
MSESVNLYIDGFNFYLAAPIRKELTDGWRNFKTLGDLLAKEHLGEGYRVGKITYVTSIVERRVSISYDESVRQETWLRMLKTVPEITLKTGEYDQRPGQPRKEKMADALVTVAAVADAADTRIGMAGVDGSRLACGHHFMSSARSRLIL